MSCYYTPNGTWSHEPDKAGPGVRDEGGLGREFGGSNRRFLTVILAELES